MSERNIEVSLYAWGFDHDGSSVPYDAVTPPLKVAGYCVHTLDLEAGEGGEHVELYEADFVSRECALAAFGEQLAKHPEAGENVYSMPREA